MSKTVVVRVTAMLGTSASARATPFQNDFSVPNIYFSAGTYSLGLHNAPFSTTGFSQFYSETTDSNLTMSAVNNIVPFNDSDWVDDAAQLAFQ
jgi:hypothetical protein